MIQEVTQSAILNLLVEASPEIERSRWRKRAAETFGDTEGGEGIRQSIEGLRYEPDAFLIDKDAMELTFFEVERHICCTCLSSLQAFEPRCGQGFECTGGPKCGSDHK